MKNNNVLWVILSLLGLSVVWVMLTACRTEQSQLTTNEPDVTIFLNTPDDVLAETLQGELQATADWVSTRSVYNTPTPEPFPTFKAEPVEGVPPNERTGLCPVPDGFLLHTRDGFCISTPESWITLNVDGGLAASLDSTPGQAISLQPDWASTPDVCSLLIYIASKSSAMDHLNARYFAFASSDNLVSLTFLEMHGFGGIAVPGFTWEEINGTIGGTYAAMLGPNRLVHIGHRGTQCLREDLVPAIETLRFEE